MLCHAFHAFTSVSNKSYVFDLSFKNRNLNSLISFPAAIYLEAYMMLFHF